MWNQESHEWKKPNPKWWTKALLPRKKATTFLISRGFKERHTEAVHSS